MNETANSLSLLRLPPTALPALRRVAAHERSPADAARMIRQLGFETGEGFYHALGDWLTGRDAGSSPDELPADLFWAHLGDFFADLGWGRLEYERVHPGVISLSGDAWTEAEPGSGAGQPTCHFTTGVLADLLTRVAGSDLAVMEVECRSGGDERCRFLLGSPDALERVYTGMRGGTPYRETLAALA